MTALLRRHRSNFAALSPSAAPSISIPTPSIIPAGWNVVLLRDFKNTGVIDLNEAQTDDGTVTDTGLYSPGKARYRLPNNGGTAQYTQAGIEGLSFGAAIDPFSPLLPLEYLFERPGGEYEPRPGEGLYIWNRPSTGPAMTAMMNAQFGNVKGNQTYGVPLRCEGLLTTYRKAAATPPFARVTWFIPNNDAASLTPGGLPNNFFWDSMWSTEDSNHAYPNDQVRRPLEIDNHETLKLGTGGRDNESNFHAPEANVRYGSWNTGNNIGRLVGICSLITADGVRDYYSINNGATWTLSATMLTTSMNGADYIQRHTAFIHSAAGGFFWLQAAGAANGDLSAILVQTSLHVPSTNTDYMVPSTSPPGEVLLSWDAAFAANLPENTRGRVGTWSGPADVTSVRVKTAGNRFATVGNEIHVVQPLQASQQPVARLHLIGVKADGSKSMGRIWSKPVSVVSGYNPFTPRAGAAIDIDLANNYAYDHGANPALSTLATADGAGGYRLIGSALTFFKRTAGTYVIEFAAGTSVDATMCAIGTDGANFEFQVWTDLSQAAFFAGADRSIPIPGATLPAANKCGVSFGAAGTMGGLNALTPVSVTNLRAPAVNDVFVARSWFPARYGLTVTRVTCWEDTNRVTAAVLTGRLA